MNKKWLLSAAIIASHGYASEFDVTAALHSQSWYATDLHEMDYRLRLDAELTYMPHENIELVIGGWLQQTDIRPQQRSSGWKNSQYPAQMGVEQAFIRYRQNDHEWTLGRQQIDWRVTDSISVADVWAPHDFSNMLDPQQSSVSALRWQWFAPVQVDLVYSPEAGPSRLPAGIWQQDTVPILPQDSSNIQEQWGIRFSSNWLQQDITAYTYSGYGYSPAAQLELNNNGIGIRPYYDSQKILGSTWVSPLDGSVMLRTEIGHIWQEDGDDYLQWVVALEKEFFGKLSEDDHWFLLLQTTDEKVTKHGKQLAGWVDFRRVFCRNLMGRLSYDPMGDEELQIKLEWSIDMAENGQYLKLLAEKRLNEHATVSLSWQQLSGTGDSFWGSYHDRDQLGITLDWIF